MTQFRTSPEPTSAPPVPPVGLPRRRPRWRWPLRIAAGLLALLGCAQPLLIGLFLGGDFDKLTAHAAVGGIFTGLSFILFLASVPGWRPGGLPGWVVAASAAVWVGSIVQIAAGYQRDLGVHVPLGVTLVAAAVAVAVRSWLPIRPTANRPCD